MPKLSVYAVLAFAALSAWAQDPAPATLWYNAGHIELNAADSAGQFSASWQFDRADNGDIRVVKQEQRGAARVSGTLLSVCGDQALAIKDIVPVRRHELQELNEPVLHLQLVLRLLARALPQGPRAVGDAAAIDLSEEKNTIRVRKGYSARRDFAAPWRVHGKLSGDAAGGIRFGLVFSYADGETKGHRSELKLDGLWQQQTRARMFDDTLAIADWRVYRVDTVATMVGGNTLLDAVAATQPLQFATLAELRARIEHAWDPAPQASKRTECKP